MAKRRRRPVNRARSSRSLDKGGLKSEVWFRAVLFAMAAAETDGDPAPAVRKALDRALDRAKASGISGHELELTLRRGAKDAQAIYELVELDPDIVIKLTPEGWSVLGDAVNSVVVH